MNHILKCCSCGKYSMKEKCDCGARAVTPKPPKFNLKDNYASYRREAKKSKLQNEGLI